jgi:Eco29kI restriction endonuclease
METPNPYNPLAKKNLAESIVSKVLLQEPSELPPNSFAGAGIYLIYYTGDFAPYKPITLANKNGKLNLPIYVGKAVPAGARKGGMGLDTPHGDALYKRLSKHADSIRAAKSTLNLSDFQCRWLVVDEVFITLGESMLISHFKPLWNSVLEGFGNNTPGVKRFTGKRPTWDVIHPGRAWAERMPADVNVQTILQKIKEHFAAPI